MIYLDHAATTAPLGDALREALSFAVTNYYNPSALYGGGVSVRREIEAARAFFLQNFENYHLVFTSGGTESDNQAIFGCARRGNAVTTMGEHPAVEQCFLQLKNRGVEPRFAKIGRDGRVDKDELLSLVDENTSLVSVVHVNSETGAINEIDALARAVKRKNPNCKFHSDGVQAYGKIPTRLGEDVDLYSVSAHKIGGLKGTGALFYRKKIHLEPHLFGGGQESNLRSGTENVLGILNFYQAAKRRLPLLETTRARVLRLRERLWQMLDGNLFQRLSPEDGTPFILTVSAVGLRGEVLQRMIESRGVVVGTGSACSSKRPHSRILQACGYDNSVLDGVLRLSFCPETTEEEIKAAANALNGSVREWKEKW